TVARQNFLSLVFVYIHNEVFVLKSGTKITFSKQLNEVHLANYSEIQKLVPAFAFIFFAIAPIVFWCHPERSRGATAAFEAKKDTGCNRG
ncbi:MAG TPA: hypothetical protein VGB44_12700, partial [Flavobacterium sp.]